MPNDDYQFHPRSIEKWHAFAALLSGEEQKEAAQTIEQLSFDLAEDNLNNLDYILSYALKNNSLVAFKYLEDNTIYYLESTITKIDSTNKKLILADKELAISTIIDMNIL